MSTAFNVAMRELAALSDARCGEPWPWAGHDGPPLDVRETLYRLLEDEVTAVAVAPVPALESGRLWAEAQRAAGELRGLLLGLPDDALDAAPPDGGWPLREILLHVLDVERSYQDNTRYAISRGSDDPLRKGPREMLTEMDRLGGIGPWVERLEDARTTGSDLAEIPADQLERPTIWMGHLIDVRFRLGRFAGHLAEHTLHAERTLESLRLRPGEAGRVVQRISAARGAHELVSPQQVLQRLDANHSARAAELATGAPT